MAIDPTVKALVHPERFLYTISLAQTDRLYDRRDDQHIRLVVFCFAKLRPEQGAYERNESEAGDAILLPPFRS
jgi:hypothetical protein